MEFDYLNDKDNYVTARELSEEFDVSEKTIKNDIAELSQLCKDAGAQLVAKRHYGYRIQVTDAQVFEQIRDKLSIYFYSSGLRFAKTIDERLLAILQTMLISDTYLTIEDLTERYFLTRSTIISNVKVIREIVASYHLRVRKPHEKGAMIQGREYDIRLLMLASIENFHYLNSIYVLTSMYERWFRLASEEERLMLRQILLNTLRKHHIQLRDDTMNQLAYYLCLIKKRYESGYRVCFNEEEVRIIRSFGLYSIIHSMFEEMAAQTEYPVDEQEILAVCLYILTHLDGNSNTALFPKRYQFRALDFVDKVAKEIDRLYQLNFAEDRDSVTLLANTVAPIMIQSDFHMASHKYAYRLHAEEELNPLAKEFSRVASMVFEHMSGQTLSISNQNVLSVAFIALLSKEGYPFRRLNIAITGSYGLNYSEITRNIFAQRFGRFLQHIDIYELYELRSFPNDRFDAVVANFGSPHHGYRYEWPLISFENLPTDKDLNRFYNDFILTQLGLKRWMKEFQIPPILRYTDCHYSDFPHFLETLALKYGHDDAGTQAIRQYLSDMEHHCFNRGGA